ncbi:phosphoglucomutase [Tepiditoga spiralis]|uniref:Phosphoglucomutase n=1 Tax=Tepiditoga spiralis TaxID=2108365 RepID=A0A7G1GBX1_9BACT|nr:phospho-sugar mutase [Tepiditoga spiralis]BBE31449.1 phosphoglucomutase [Tepiditoga spiralis]
MNYMERYKSWLKDKNIDEKTKEELKKISDEKEIQDRFYKDLEFGTAGLRGKLGAGTNRMNIYTVSKATQGFANFINKQSKEYAERGVAIAHDSRHMSKEFALDTALIFAANGIKAFLFEDLRPTPELSFSILHLKTAGGIVITASHNPKEYNGYKAYWEDGAQITSKIADPLTEEINNVNDFSTIKRISKEEAIEKGLLKIIGKEIDDIYIEKVKKLSITDDVDKDLCVVYTPLNGTGNKPVRRVLKERGFLNVHVVPEQENPDPDFTTVGYPNPEDTKAFKYSINLGKSVDADLLVATDPDCDRLAIMVKHNNEYVSFSGNQTGAILIKYIIDGLKGKNALPKNGAIIKSIVTGDLGKRIGQENGITTFETLTGFKNICGKENEITKNGEYELIFGYEESIGFKAGDFVKDKDAVISSMLLVEAAAYYKKRGKTLKDVLDGLFEEFGYYLENNFSIILEGIEGQERIKRIMKEYRNLYPKEFSGIKMIKYIDYLEMKEHDLVNNSEKETDVPKSNVLRYFFEDGSWYALRPSGTEPKLKVYIYSIGKTMEDAKEKLNAIKEKMMEIIDSVE